MSKAKKIAIISDTSGNLSGTNLSGTNTGDQVIPVASSTAPAALGVATVGTQSTDTTAPSINLFSGVTSTAVTKTTLFNSFPMKMGGEQYWYY